MCLSCSRGSQQGDTREIPGRYQRGTSQRLRAKHSGAAARRRAKQRRCQVAKDICGFPRPDRTVYSTSRHYPPQISRLPSIVENFSTPVFSQKWEAEPVTGAFSPPYVPFSDPNLRHSDPLPSSGILGEVGLVMSYFIVVVLFRENN